MADIINNILRADFLPSKLAAESTLRAGKVIDALIELYKDFEAYLLTNITFLKQVKEQLENTINVGKVMAKSTIIVPVGALGLFEGFSAPDLDITILGIGHHRFFLFHSAIGLAVLRYFYHKWVASANSSGILAKVGQKCTGALLSGFALGVAIHLMIDVFQPKSVSFPFFGSLIDGTLIDDNIWLLGNSLWAFRISHDVFTLTFADELATAKKYVRDKFDSKAIILK